MIHQSPDSPDLPNLPNSPNSPNSPNLPDSSNSQNSQLAQAKEQYGLGKTAFERGEYRRSIAALETTLSLINPYSSWGAMVQLELVMAYEGAGERQAARDLCRQLENHPDWQTRKQASRLLYILEAPQLNLRPEWLVEIPDLSQVEGGNSPLELGEKKPSSARAKPVEKVFIPAVESGANAQSNNSFVWIALGTIALVWVLWWSVS